MASDNALAHRRWILEELYQVDQAAPGSFGGWAADRDLVTSERAREAEYLKAEGLIEGVIGADHGAQIRLTSRGRDYVEMGGFGVASTSKQRDAEPALGGSLDPARPSPGGLGSPLAMPLGGPARYDVALSDQVEVTDSIAVERTSSSRVVEGTGTTQGTSVASADSVNASSAAPDWVPFSDTPFQLTRGTHPNEHALGVDDYARALAKLMNAALGEFCFAVYGHWGRGKTFLMQRVQKMLPTTYQTVWFSAWKYRTTPEIWVYLYETVAQAARASGPCRAIPRATRAHLSAHGVWPSVLALGGLALSIFGIGLVPVLVGILGVIGVLKAYAVSRWFKKLPARLFSLPQHVEKLGLQAAIGDDLISLLKGWIPTVQNKSARVSAALPHWGWLLPYLTGVGAVALALNTVLQGGQHGPWPLHPESDVRWAAVIATTLILGVALPVWVVCVGRATERVCLIVDDLDRCDPSTLVDVIESLKILLEDPEVSERVQVVMLLDEESLEYAIGRRYRHFRKDPLRDPDSVRVRAFVETSEKLFIAHLRLPRLDQAELVELMKRYVEQPSLRDQLRVESVVIEQSATATQHPGKATETQSGTGPPAQSPEGRDPQVEQSAGSVKRATTNDAAANPDDLLFSAEEREALLKAVKVLTARSGSRPLGPRALRAFLTRYQLAKFLLAARKTRCAPQQLVDLLAHQAQSKGPDGNVNAVVAEVS